jgi:hypothetical protein
MPRGPSRQSGGGGGPRRRRRRLDQPCRVGMPARRQRAPAGHRGRAEHAGGHGEGPGHREATGPATGTTTAASVMTAHPGAAKIGPDLGFKPCAPTATRTRDLLLRRHFPNVASRRSRWPDMGPSRSENGWMWTDVAWCQWSLAPRLAPRKIVSRANVRASRATCSLMLDHSRPTTSLGLAGPLSALDASRQARLRG